MQLPIYAQLESVCLRLIKRFRTDLLVHDQEWIDENPFVPFVHVVRPTGTHLIGFLPADKYPPKGEVVPHLFGHTDREGVLRGCIQLAKCAVADKTAIRAHYYDGCKLKRISLSRVLELTKEYAQRIRREWDQE